MSNTDLQEQRIKNEVRKAARSYFNRDPDGGAKVRITDVILDKHEGNEWDVRVTWDDPEIDQSTTFVDDLLYTVTVDEQGEIFDVHGPEF